SNPPPRFISGRSVKLWLFPTVLCRQGLLASRLGRLPIPILPRRQGPVECAQSRPRWSCRQIRAKRDVQGDGEWDAQETGGRSGCGSTLVSRLSVDEVRRFTQKRIVSVKPILHHLRS